MFLALNFLPLSMQTRPGSFRLLRPRPMPKGSLFHAVALPQPPPKRYNASPVEPSAPDQAVLEDPMPRSYRANILAAWVDLKTVAFTWVKRDQKRCWWLSFWARLSTRANPELSPGNRGHLPGRGVPEPVSLLRRSFLKRGCASAL